MAFEDPDGPGAPARPDRPDPASSRGGPASQPIKAVPVRHPGRWVAAVVITVLTAMFIHMVVTNDRFEWDFIFDNMFAEPILRGVRTTVLITLLAMAGGIGLGIVVALMRLSRNPILVPAAWLFTWFFRGVPRVVLLILFGNVAILWERLEFGLPFDRQIGRLFGFEDFSARLFGFEARALLAGFLAGLIALTLSEAAYMAEIVRAGILSVESGQSEAAAALGLSRAQAMRRIVLPQAMRSIIPPTGNELIALLKDTSLLAFVPVTSELWFQLQAIGARTFKIFPMLVAGCLWYLFLTSILMVGQYFVERYYSRGYGTATQARVRLRGFAGGQGAG